MEKQTRNILFISVGTIVLLGAGIGIYLATTSKKDEEDQLKADQRLGDRAPNMDSNSPEFIPSDESNWVEQNQSSIGLVSPSFNVEGELSNPYSQIKGRILYPKAKGDGNGLGYTNVRTSAEVNNDRGWWDFTDNLLTTISGDKAIGKVIGQTSSELNSYGYRWYKVWLMEKVGFWGLNQGWVRADTVTFKPY